MWGGEGERGEGGVARGRARQDEGERIIQPDIGGVEKMRGPHAS